LRRVINGIDVNRQAIRDDHLLEKPPQDLLKAIDETGGIGFGDRLQALGNRMVKVVPSIAVKPTSTLPPCALATSCTM